MEAIEIMDLMVDIYGVASSYNNVDEEHTLEDEGLWFTCPECAEPILLEDYDFDEYIDDEGYIVCPICGERMPLV